MAKYIIKEKLQEIDLGDKQILKIRKPGFAKLATLAKENVDNIDLLIQLIVDSAEEWSGFINDENKPVEFSKETLRALLQSLDADQFNDFTSKTSKVLFPSEKETKQKEAEIKNLKSTTK